MNECCHACHTHPCPYEGVRKPNAPSHNNAPKEVNTMEHIKQELADAALESLRTALQPKNETDFIKKLKKLIKEGVIC